MLGWNNWTMFVFSVTYCIGQNSSSPHKHQDNHPLDHSTKWFLKKQTQYVTNITTRNAAWVTQCHRALQESRLTVQTVSLFSVHVPLARRFLQSVQAFVKNSLLNALAPSLYAHNTTASVSLDNLTVGIITNVFRKSQTYSIWRNLMTSYTAHKQTNRQPRGCVTECSHQT